MSVLGVGPRIAISGMLSIAIVFAIESTAGDASYSPVPRGVAVLLGTSLMITGVFFWLDSLRLIATRFREGVLIRSGVYRFVRNPMYAGFIVFIVPGLSLVLDNPYILIASIVMLVVFRLSIHREEEFLANRFGDAYREYAAKVKQIIPFVW